MSFGRLFIPSVSKPGQPFSNILIEGAHLFTQFDWHVVTLTCMLFAYLQMEQGTRIHAPLASMLKVGTEWETLLAMGSIAVITAFFGPGAAGSFGLAVREYGLRAVTKSLKTL